MIGLVNFPAAAPRGAAVLFEIGAAFVRSVEIGAMFA